MNKAIIGRKLGMTQIFTETGLVIPVTVVEAGPCAVVQKKTVERDGYSAVQFGFEEITKLNRTNKAIIGHCKKANLGPMKTFKEFRLDNADSFEVGQIVKADVFEAGEKVDVSGVTRGRGFTGTIQRWNQARLRMSHGTGPVHREVGSMGANSTPSRVLKSKKMPGQYGVENVTIRNLTVVRVDAERNVLLIKGAIPGPKGGLVSVVDAKA